MRERLGGKILLAAAAMLVGMWLGGCTEFGVTDETCRAGERCSCRTAGTCTLTCEGRGCDFFCGGAGTCELICEDGGCRAEIGGQGDGSLACPGGSCDLLCHNAGNCELVDCPDDGNCNLECHGVGTCTWH